MRQLFITRGIPGSGKSTFLQSAGLGPYTLSPDTLRLAYSSPVMNDAGRIVMPYQDDRRVWQQLHELLDMRMTRGELIVVDATHTTSSYFQQYVQLAQKYRYKLYIIDFADVPLRVCLERNRQRVPHKIVDDAVLEKMHARLSTCAIPKQYTVIQPAAVKELIASYQQPINLSQYEHIHHIGDIQGCYTPLREYFEQHPYTEHDYYIFTGDLLDRGTENAEVLQYVCDNFVDKPNVTFIEGNHDGYIWQWLTHQPIRAREFNGRTRAQLERANIDKRAVSRLMNSMQDCLYYTWHDKRVFVSHAGVSNLPENPLLLASQQYIRGVGRYDQVGAIDDAFVAHTSDNVYQVHGHRNAQNYPAQYNQRCFNLEGKVEFGGTLRVAQLAEKGWSVVEISNQSAEGILHPENAPLIHGLRTNKLINERSLPGNISSFHFKPKVFYDKKWTAQTVRARGLFMNTLTNEIVIRAYDKFFNIGERRETEFAALKDQLVFPVRAWVKENGYLGLVGYDATLGDLVFASKTTTESDFAGWFRRLFLQRYGKHVDVIRQYLAEHNVCLVCEVMLPTEDPHIIEYVQDRIVLLDIVHRQEKFAAVDQVERERFAAMFGMEIKRLAATLQTWEEFATWYEQVQGLDYLYDGVPIEGFVIEDARHWQVKAKLDYYSFWKRMRGVLDGLKAGRSPKRVAAYPHPEYAARVIAYMQGIPTDVLAQMSIIDVRHRWQREQEKAV